MYITKKKYFLGLLLKPLTVSKSKDSIDYIFATYWLLPKFGAQILIDDDIECVKQKMLNSASSKGKVLYLNFLLE